jgi:hypothetical protein
LPNTDNALALRGREPFVNGSIQVTPAYPPDISGVGDYAALLSAKFCEAGEPMATLVARPDAPERAPSDEVIYLARKEAEALAQAIDEYDRVLLHFSGYGYARRGLCSWLVDGLSLWKARGRERRLVTVFHEVYATGPIWRSSFWTALPQRRIARDLARLSDKGFVSSQGGYDHLQLLYPNLPLEVLEVFSNVGELDGPPTLGEKAPLAAVFGGVGRRGQVYRSLRAAGEGARDALRHAGINRILDIGPRMDVPNEIAGCEVQACGPLPTADVSDLLSGVRIGLLNYRRDRITKSGIAAAYFAHGLLVVNTGDKGRYPRNIREGIHLADLWRLQSGSYNAPAIAAAGWERYRTHGIGPTVRRLREAFGTDPSIHSENDRYD